MDMFSTCDSCEINHRHMLPICHSYGVNHGHVLLGFLPCSMDYILSEYSKVLTLPDVPLASSSSLLVRALSNVRKEIRMALETETTVRDKEGEGNFQQRNNILMYMFSTCNSREIDQTYIFPTFHSHGMNHMNMFLLCHSYAWIKRASFHPRFVRGDSM